MFNLNALIFSACGVDLLVVSRLRLEREAKLLKAQKQKEDELLRQRELAAEREKLDSQPENLVLSRTLTPVVGGTAVSPCDQGNMKIQVVIHGLVTNSILQRPKSWIGKP